MSADPPDTAARFRDELGAPFALVGDPDGRILRAWGTRWPLVGVARRVTFVVGRDRRVEWRLWSELDVTSHARGALEALSAAD